MYGIKANVITDRALRVGASVVICFCNGDAESPFVSGLSKGGRKISKYTKYSKLGSFRAAWLHDDSDVAMKWGSKAEAEIAALQLADKWSRQ